MLGGGVVMYLVKISVVTKWNASTSILEVRSFLCLAKYYNLFVKDFLNMTSPLMNFLKKKSYSSEMTHVAEHFRI